MQPDEMLTPPKPLPTWLSIPIILLCLTSGGWIIHWYVMTDPISHESKILGDPPAQPQWPGAGLGGRNRNNFGPRREIQDRGQGNWEARTEQARAVVNLNKGKAAVRNLFYIGNYSFVPDDVKKTLFATRSLIADATRTTGLKLTSAQVNKLRALSFTITMVVKPEDKELLGTEIAAYVAANEKERPALEAKALKTLDDIAGRSTDATRKEAVDHAEQINKIMTPDLWKQNAAMGGGGK